ncbi:hypothetical protein [Haloplanus salinus]|uniref:hypothetical protein n=1 Tax=Haloplanus salinus TaxID=1126245 RepID=UPI0015F0AD7D|nr:hypothetical protein [Haloplanus salinus]
MTNIPSPAEQSVLDQLPATTSEIAVSLNYARSSVRGFLSRLRKKGYVFDRDSSGVYEVSASPKSETEQLRRSTQHVVASTDAPLSKQTETKLRNEHLRELNARLDALLNETPPALADGGLAYEVGHEDVVIHRTDDHIGAFSHDEFGNVIFDDEIAAERIREVTRRAMELIDRQEAAGSVFDTAHLLLGGDIVTGEGIFPSQAHELCLNLDEQIDLAVELYFEQIQELSARFPTVQVVCQPGNHGELRVKGPSAGANADSAVYKMLARMVSISSMTNVTVIQNESTLFTNFTMRNSRWRGHLRHGHKSLSHIGTNSAKERWGTWVRRHKFDIAYRGHFHETKIEHILGINGLVPVIMSGSISPPGDYEESIGVWGAPTATVHGVSDSRPLTWMYPLYFDDAIPSAPEPAVKVVDAALENEGEN